MPKIKVKEPKPDQAERQYLNNALRPLFERSYDLPSVIPIKLAFHALPLRSYTDYYKIIKKPQSMHKISQAIKNARYDNAQEFVVDMVQITWNARFYNEIGSDYYESAVVLDNYIKEEVIPALQSDPKIFGGSKVSYPYLGPLPGEEPATFESLANSDADNTTFNQYEVEHDFKEKKPEYDPYQKIETDHNKELTALYHEVESQQQFASPAPQQQQQQQHQHQQYEPIPSFSTSSIPPSVFKDYEPTPVEQVLTLDQTTAMTPKPSPIVLNTTTALPPHPNQREVFETWNKRGKPPVIDKPHEQRIKSIMRVMKKQRNARGEPLYLPFERLPNQQTNPQYYRKIQNPICLEIIRTKIKQRKYPDVESYLTDLFLVIENNKLYASQAPDPRLLNEVIEFETVCKRLISEELAKPDSVYLTSDAHGMRIPIDLLDYNGRKYKIGDWVLLRNPNDETKPIPAQIFRIWSTPEDGNKRYINVCWYYRPEQTVHRVDRLFYENEVFKTGQYRDHLVQDILGPCYVNYFTRYQRGEPAFKVFGPMFVCEFRYSDHDKNFNKIRTWKACIPDEVREIDDPIIPLPNGGLRWFQKYTSPLMHLLPPNATINDPIPEPIIASLNAPPLIGGVYKRGPALDDDLGQYLSSPARNLVVRKNITQLNNIGTRNDSPMPSQQHMAMQSQSSPQNGHNNNRQFTPQFNYVPQFTQNTTQTSQQNTATPSPLSQQISTVPQEPAQSPYDYASSYQASRYYKNNTSHYNQAFTGKVVPSPYSQVIHTVSNFHQSTSSPTFIIPNRLQKKLDDNDELTNIFSNKMDLVNKERLMKFSPSYMITELQQYDLLNKLKEPSVAPKSLKRKAQDDQDVYASDETDDEEDEEANGVQTMQHEQEQQPISKKTPSLWFRGAPVYVKNRIVNESVHNKGNNHILRFNKASAVSTSTKVKSTIPSGSHSLAREEFQDTLPPVRRRVRKTELGQNGEEIQSEIVEDEGEIVEEEQQQEIQLHRGELNSFGPSAEYLAFRLRNKVA